MRGSPVKQPNLYPPKNQPLNNFNSEENKVLSPLSELRKKLSSRGVRGFIKFYQKFSSVLNDNQGEIPFSAFT
jgi:hypothetical protein